MTWGGGRTLDRGLALARDLERDVYLLRDLDRDLAFARDLDRDLGLDRDLVAARDVKGALLVALDGAAVSACALGLARDLDCALGLARDLVTACDLAGDFVSFLDRGRTSDLDLGRGLGRARISGRARDFGLVRDLCLDLSRVSVRGRGLVGYLEGLDAGTPCVRAGERRAVVRVAPVAGRLVAGAARMLPARVRARYAEEFRAELWEIARADGGRWPQLGYAARQVMAAPRLHAGLRIPAGGARCHGQGGDGGAQASWEGGGRDSAGGSGSEARPTRARNPGFPGCPGGRAGLLVVRQRCPDGPGQPGTAGLARRSRPPDRRRRIGPAGAATAPLALAARV